MAGGKAGVKGRKMQVEKRVNEDPAEVEMGVEEETAVVEEMETGYAEMEAGDEETGDAGMEGW